MICKEFFEITGLECFPLDETGNVAYVASPFVFEDGEPFPIYVREVSTSHVSFFDDGEIILHFLGRGFRGSKNKLNTTFLSNIADSHGLTLTDSGVLQGSAHKKEAPELFAKYIAAIFAITQWEKEFLNNDQSTLELIAKVEFALKAWRPNAKITKKPVYKGSSNKDYEFTFEQNNEGILVISSSPQAINAATRKLLDVSSSRKNNTIKTRVIIDDALLDASTREQNRSVLSYVCDYVQSFDNLETIAYKNASMLPTH